MLRIHVTSPFEWSRWADEISLFDMQTIRVSPVSEYLLQFVAVPKGVEFKQIK